MKVPVRSAHRETGLGLPLEITLLASLKIRPGELVYLALMTD